MTRDQIRGWLIIIGLALIATVFFNVSQQIAGIVFGALGLLFIVLMWYFGYSWYRDNLTAISLMPDRQRNALYAGAGALTGAAGHVVARQVRADRPGRRSRRCSR